VNDHPFARCYERRAELGNEDRYLLALAQRFAYVFPHPRLLEVVRRFSPLVELGAGTGYWAYLLTAIGADVIAYDMAPVDGPRTNRYHREVRPWSLVLGGDAGVLAEHRSRSLFLCWPPRYSSLWESIQHYSGDHVLCITDGGRRTAAFAGLEERFVRIEAHPAVAMDPEPGTRVELGVWRRRR
jgi:hypothetical protein